MDKQLINGHFLETKNGKSRMVKIYEKLVAKIALVNNRSYLENKALNLDGEFENLKEIYIYESLKDKKLYRETLANILEYDISKKRVVFEKLEIVNPDIFYKKFYEKYKFLKSNYKLVFDNHTLDNHKNFGTTKNNKLKILDYAITSESFFQFFDLEINSEDDYKKLKQKIISDIQNRNFEKKDLLYRSTLGIIFAIKYHDNLVLFLLNCVIHNILNIKEAYYFLKLNLQNKRSFI